jgi:hypothetical protein
MKYYVYISDTKVDMLYSQIPKKMLDKIAVELGINLGMFRLNVKGKEDQEKTRFEKLKLVVNYIENNLDVGTVDEPKAYFKGSLPMRWGRFGSDSGLVYFGGRTAAQTVLGLGGSMAHVIVKQTGGYHPSGESIPLEIKVALWRELNLPDPTEVDPVWDTIPEGLILDATDRATRMMEGPLQTFEFSAKRLVETPVEKPLHVLLGTPIYVAMVY